MYVFVPHWLLMLFLQRHPYWFILYVPTISCTIQIVFDKFLFLCSPLTFTLIYAVNVNVTGLFESKNSPMFVDEHLCSNFWVVMFQIGIKWKIKNRRACVFDIMQSHKVKNSSFWWKNGKSKIMHVHRTNWMW